MNTKSDLSSLPMMAMDVIPKPNPDAKKIVALVRESGKITGYKLSDGQIVDKAEGVMMAKQGYIQGVGVAHKYDTEYLKAIPDGTEGNNLGSLPTVMQ